MCLYSERTPSDPSRSVFDPKSVLLSGYMSKRSADHVTSVVGPLTFKKRFFRLSHKTLSYANSDYEQVFTAKFHFNSIRCAGVVWCCFARLFLGEKGHSCEHNLCC